MLGDVASLLLKTQTTPADNKEFARHGVEHFGLFIVIVIVIGANAKAFAKIGSLILFYSSLWVAILVLAGLIQKGNPF